MHVRNLAFAAVLSAPLLLLAACGADSQKTLGSADRLARTPTSATNPGPTAIVSGTSSNPAEPAPVLGGNITKISPVHGAKVRQTDTTSPNPNNPRGACAEVNFTDLPENFQWFFMVFDGQDVTNKLVLIPNSLDNPTNGGICYAPEKGFTVGHHIVGIAVQSPRDSNASPRQIVQWSFDVIP